MNFIELILEHVDYSRFLILAAHIDLDLHDWTGRLPVIIVEKHCPYQTLQLVQILLQQHHKVARLCSGHTFL